MKTNLCFLFLLASTFAAFSETEEQINKRLPVQSGGKLVVDVDFGTIDIQTNGSSEVVVDVLRRIGRESKEVEEEFLAERPVTFSQDNNTVTIYSRAKNKNNRQSRGKQRTEAKYTITVPSQFGAQLKTDGGAISVSDLSGEVKAGSNGGALNFTRVHGPLNAGTAGGPIEVTDCEGTQKLSTSGGGIKVSGGSGSVDGKTSGGPVAVKDFRGEVEVKSSGGALTLANITGKINGATSGGQISASFAAPLSEALDLKTLGGGVTLQVPENSAFDLDAATTAGRVSSELTVNADGKPSGNRLKGPVNGGGQPVILRTTGGNIQVRKL